MEEHNSKRDYSSTLKVEAAHSSETSVSHQRIGVCSLFNAAASNFDYIASNDWMGVNTELERMCKEASVV